jgi:hypothetical protein
VPSGIGWTATGDAFGVAVGAEIVGAVVAVGALVTAAPAEQAAITIARPIAAGATLPPDRLSIAFPPCLTTTEVA